MNRCRDANDLAYMRQHLGRGTIGNDANNFLDGRACHRPMAVIDPQVYRASERTWPLTDEDAAIAEAVCDAVDPECEYEPSYSFADSGEMFVEFMCRGNSWLIQASELRSRHPATVERMVRRGLRSTGTNFL